MIRRAFWIFTAITAAVVIIIFIFMLGSLAYLNRDATRTTLIDSVRNTTGLNLVVDGPLKLDWWPAPALRADKIILSTDRTGLDSDQVNASAYDLTGIDVSLRIFPLLFKRLELEINRVDVLPVSVTTDEKVTASSFDDVRVEVKIGNTPDSHPISQMNLMVGESDLLIDFHSVTDNHSTDVRFLSHYLDVDALIDSMAGPQIEMPVRTALPVMLPVKWLQEYGGTASFQVDKMIAANVLFESMSISGYVNKQNIILDQIESRIADGQLAGTLTLSESADTQLDFALSIQNAAIEDLLRPLERISLGWTKSVSGLADIEIKLGLTVDSGVVRPDTVNGSIDVVLNSLRFEGLDAGRLISTMRDTDSTAPAATTNMPDGQIPTTVVDRARGRLEFVDGMGRNDDLLATANQFSVRGSGTLDLAADAIDYRLSLISPGAGQGGVEKLLIPLQVSGQLSSPNIRINMDALMQSASSPENQQNQ
ncbi:MAG: hypothetical protein DHS20C01_18720 [marine bacterium B5-7]|nr:MAG: hypothetical protein DHS20C01_18720 [marine bacterium B5-7]